MSYIPDLVKERQVLICDGPTPCSAMHGPTWSDNGYQWTQEIDCCGFNKSIVLVFGI